MHLYLDWCMGFLATSLSVRFGGNTIEPQGHVLIDSHFDIFISIKLMLFFIFLNADDWLFKDMFKEIVTMQGKRLGRLYNEFILTNYFQMDNTLVCHSQTVIYSLMPKTFLRTNQTTTKSASFP